MRQYPRFTRPGHHIKNEQKFITFECGFLPLPGV